MSQPTQFTAEEEKNFKEWDFQRRRGEQLLWYNSGIPMTSRQEEWLKEKERRDRAARPEYARPSPQQPAWGAHQSYSSYSPPSFVATSESFEEYPASNPPEGPESPRGSLGPNGDYSPPDEPNPQAQKRTAGLEMTRSGDNRRDILMHSRKNGWRGLIATLDTGTDDNWISEKVVDRLNLSVKSGLPVRYTTVDGRQISSGATVNPTWTIQGQSNTIVTEFRMAPKEAPFDVLFGRNLLSSGEVDFDSEDSPIQVLVPRKIKKEEQQVIDKNEAAAEAQRMNLSQQPQPVKRDSSGTKSTKRSLTQMPKDKSRGKAGDSQTGDGKARDGKARDKREN